MKKTTLFKSLILASLCFSLILASCSDGVSDNGNDIDYTVAEGELRSDYSQYTIGAITWSTQRGYQIGAFSATAKSQNQPQSITAWYSVSGETAIREMDSEDLGTTVPASIDAAFKATDYDDTTLWRIEEIELEHNYDTNPSTSYYDMELDGIGTNSTLEAELYFSTEPTGTLLYSKEKLDDDDDSDDDKFVINAQLKAAVEKVAPDATIIDAEVDDNMIEVEAITADTPPKEVELKFTMNYVWVSTEIKYTYGTLPTPDFDVVKNWFVANPSTPAPTTNPEVEITEGNQSETEHSIGDYYYEVEIDDYIDAGTEYEVEFYLSKSKDIIAVIVNDRKQ